MDLPSVPIETLKNFSHANILRIYSGKTVVFFGDTMIRKLYRDLSRFLHKDELMNNTELKTKHYGLKTYTRKYFFS